jgi:hypothetical protein
MGDASYLQTNFLGGQWSPYAQGRGDDEHYRTAMNLCFNNIPLEVGACTRRSGTLFAATTRNGAQAALKAFHFVQQNPFLAEFTPGFLRIFAGTSLLLQNPSVVGTISQTNPAVVATTLVNGFSTGDQVEFNATPIPGTSPAGLTPLFNRQFSITVVDTQHFSLQDPVTGANIDGSTIDITGWVVTVARVVTFTTPYTAADLPNLRLVQNEDLAFSLVQTRKPQALLNTVAPVAGAGAVFSWTQPTFIDGPYFDPPTDGTTLTPSAVSGSITLMASSIASINGGLGFVATDVGRMIRLYSEPANWASGTSYSKGTNVKFNNTYWQASAANHNVEPDTDNGTNWVIAPTAAAWTWGTIGTVTDTSHVIITLAAADPYGVNAGGNLLYTVPILTWQLGLYSDTTGYPAGGCYHEGRFWLFGAQQNRLDSTMSNQNFMFSPTLLDGTVADNCGISAIFEGQDRNAVLWTEPDHQGIIIGTQAGEWLIQASSLNEPLTPTSIQAHRVTGYGCANVEPVYTGLSHVFVQRYQLQVYEYLADVYSQKFQGTNIARKAKNLTTPGVAQIAYQRELAPLLWCRTTDGRLLSCTYKRESPFSTQPASYMGWAPHALGSGRIVEAIQVGPSPNGNTDSLALITNDPSTNIRYVEVMSSIFEETDPITNAWYLDAAVTPASAQIVGTNLVLYGLEYIAGKTITAWVAGIDVGDYTVSASGTLTLPLDGTATGTGGPLFNTAALAALTGGNYSNLNLSIQVTPVGSGFFSPFASLSDYVFSHSPGLHYADGFVDFDGNNAIFEAAQVGGDPGTDGHSLYMFNAKTQVQTAGPLDPGQLAFSGVIGGRCIGVDGNIYYGGNDATHRCGRYNTHTQTNDINFVDTHSLDAVGNIQTITLAGAHYVFYASINSGGVGSRINVIAMDTAGGPTWGGTTFTVAEAPGSLTGANALTVRGPQDSGIGYVLAGDLFPACGVSTVMGCYVVSAAAPGSVGMVRTGGITLTQVNTLAGTAWTSFGMGAPVFDETDGNIILMVEGSDSTVRIMKVNPLRASLVWISAAVNISTEIDLSRYRVRGGRLTLIGSSPSPFIVYELNTLTGALNTSNTETLASPGVVMGDDKSGLLVFKINDITNTQWATFGPAPGGGSITPAVVYNAPAVIGFNYVSQGQILRALNQQEAGSPNGPAQAKSRRIHMFGALMANSQGVSFGTDFAHMNAAQFTSAGGTIVLPVTTLYSGTWWDAIDDDYGFDGMWAWTTTRPYPTTVVSVECFIHTQDR